MSVTPTRLGEVLTLERRVASPSLSGYHREIGVRSFGRGLFVKEPVTGASLGDKRVFHVHPGDLVVSNVFAWEGAIAVADERHEGTIGSHRFMTWTSMGDRADPRYLVHFLLSEAGLRLLGQASPGSAGRNRTLSIVNFQKLIVPLPDLPEQRRIAAYLDSVNTTIERLAEQRLVGPDLTNASILPRMVLRTIQSRTLPLAAVGDLVDSVNDTIHPGDDGRGADQFVGLEHVESHTGFMVGSRPVREETGRKFRFEPGDITFGYLRPYLNKVWVADRTGLCSVEQFVLRPRGGVDASLLAHVLRSQDVLDATRAATNSLQLPRLPLRVLLGLRVPDIRLADSELLTSLNDLRAKMASLVRLRAKGVALAAGLLPAARNEVFSAMR